MNSLLCVIEVVNSSSQLFFWLNKVVLVRLNRLILLDVVSMIKPHFQFH